MARLEDPKYSVAMTIRTGDNKTSTRSFGYVNLDIAGGTSVDYDQTEVYDFLQMTCESITGGTFTGAYITAQYPIIGAGASSAEVSNNG